MRKEVGVDTFNADATAGNTESFTLSRIPTDVLGVFVDGEPTADWELLGAGIIEIGSPPRGAVIAVVYEYAPTALLPEMYTDGPILPPQELDWEAGEIDPVVFYQYRAALESKRAAEEARRGNDRDDLLAGIAGAFVVGVGLAAVYDEFF